MCASADAAGRQGDIRVETKTFMFVFQQKLLAKINEIDENKQMLFFPKKKHVKQGNHFCENFLRHKIFGRFSPKYLLSRKYAKTGSKCERNFEEIGCFAIIGLIFVKTKRVREYSQIWKCLEEFRANYSIKNEISHFPENGKGRFCFNPRWGIEIRALLCKLS